MYCAKRGAAPLLTVAGKENVEVQGSGMYHV